MNNPYFVDPSVDRIKVHWGDDIALARRNGALIDQWAIAGGSTTRAYITYQRVRYPRTSQDRASPRRVPSRATYARVVSGSCRCADRPFDRSGSSVSVWFCRIRRLCLLHFLDRRVLFNFLTFVVFFALIYLGHRLLSGWQARKDLLLGASYAFYAAWNRRLHCY